MNLRPLHSLLGSCSVAFLAACATTGKPPVTPTPTPTPGPTASTTVYRLQIGTVGRASLRDSEADSVLAAATRVVRDVDSSRDTSANIQLQRSGPVRALSGPAVINSASDFSKLAATGVNVAVVEAINDCGGFSPGIVGCAPVPGSFMAVVRLGNNEDILWAHEFGHNCGLSHRNDSEALMHPQLGAKHRSLLSTEASRFEAKSRALSPSIMQPILVTTDGAPPASVSEYLGRQYVHGIPFAHVSVFQPKDVPELKSALANPALDYVRTNAVVALAAIGTPEATDAVTNYIFAGSGTLTPGAYQAKRAGLMALAYTTQNSASRLPSDRRERVLAQLHDGIAPQFWAKRVKWRGPTHSSTAQTADRLSDTAVAALALSGAKEAKPWLLEAAQRPGNDSARQAHLERATSEYNKVRSLGVRSYTDLRRRRSE